MVYKNNIKIKNNLVKHNKYPSLIMTITDITVIFTGILVQRRFSTYHYMSAWGCIPYTFLYISLLTTQASKWEPFTPPMGVIIDVWI
jgi:hypothetical protein